jgi:hypothetical protein
MWISPEWVPSNRCVVESDSVILVIGDLWRQLLVHGRGCSLLERYNVTL